MQFAVSPEQEMLRESVRAYLDDKAPMSVVRGLMETEDGFDPVMWKDMAGMGWPSMAVPEEYGGAGFTYLELAVVMEEFGRSLTPAPFLSSVVLGGGALMIAGSPSQRGEYLPGVSSGELRVAVALAEPGRGWGAGDVELDVRREAGALRLTGTKSYVIDGHTADLLIVAGRDGDDVDLFVVDPAGDGVETRRLETMDMTRKQAAVELSGAVAVDRLGVRGAGSDAVRRLLDLGAVMLAYEQVGGAQRCMEMSVAYAKERTQFGRPIGSFQAVKHKCAQMLVDVESARSTAMYAGWALVNGSDDAGVAAALAKARCSDAFFDVAAEMIQVYGGIGFTWEHDAHLYFKRAKTDQLLFGGSAEWRSTLGERLGL